jgi:hypothetical protein
LGETFVPDRVEEVAAVRDSSAKPWLIGTGLAVTVIALIKLAVHLYAGRGYGYFVDELYYLDCARHLDWGYVDQPPLIAAVTWLVRATVGDSLSAIRLLPAFCGAALVLLTGLLTRELGGGRFAQGLAALCILLAPGLLGIDHFLSMNCMEPLFWIGCAWLIVRIIRTGDTRLWLWFGVLAGVGLENKYSMGIFGFGLVAGLLLTRQRRLLASKWFWIGSVLALLLFLPNLLWNIQHHFPFLELQQNIKRNGRNVALPPLRFLGQEIEAMMHLSLPIWLGGLWFFFFRREGRQFCFLGWAWILTALVIVVENPRVYYLFPAFPVLFAGGAVLWERWTDKPGLAWLRWGWCTAMILFGALLAPLAIPLPPPQTYIRYTIATHLQQPTIENHRMGPLPQLFADQFGWPEMAAEVARVYNSLPADVRPRMAIFAQTYGQAGAIDLFGPRLGLPPALSGHQSHFLWGPGGYTGESMIVMDDDRAALEQIFTSVEVKGQVTHPYSMPYNHFNIYYCRGLKQPLAEFWPQVKKWD